MAPLQGNNLYRAIISKEIEKRDRYFILKENCIKSFSLGSFTNAKSIQTQ